MCRWVLYHRLNVCEGGSEWKQLVLDPPASHANIESAFSGARIAGLSQLTDERTHAVLSVANVLL